MMNKFDYEDNNFRKPTDEEEQIIFTEKFLVKEIFGKKVLLDNGRQIMDLYPCMGEGVHYFAVRGSDDDPEIPCSVEDKVAVNRIMSMIATEDILSEEREKIKDTDMWAIKEVNEDESVDIGDYNYLLDNLDQYEDGDVDDNKIEVETSTINDFVHRDDDEYLICIEEVIHHNVYVRAKSEDEARYIAARKYEMCSDFVNTVTDGSIDDVLIAVEGKESKELDEFIDTYSIHHPGIN